MQLLQKRRLLRLEAVGEKSDLLHFEIFGG
jgi:hypothetical protein